MTIKEARHCEERSEQTMAELVRDVVDAPSIF